MPGSLLRALIVAAMLAFAMPAARADNNGQADLIATLLPSVVNITTTSYVKPPPETKGRQPAAMSFAKTRSIGSGFIVHPSGLIVTNRHVVERGIDFEVFLSDGTRLKGELVAEAEGIDIAVLRVHAPGPLPAVKLGDSDKLRQGDAVIAIGNPLGFSSSVSTGVVSALDRDIHSSIFDNYIQTDATINHGNSGGPLFNARGEVVGINSEIYTTSDKAGSIGLGFAIPINDAKFVVPRLIRYGRVSPAWLGVTMQQVTNDIATAVGLSVADGGIITSITPDSPGLAAGLREGDIILKVGTGPETNARALQRAIAASPVDMPVPLSVWRDGKPITLTAKLRELPASAMMTRARTAAAREANEKPPPAPDMGLRLVPITAEVRQKHKLAAGQEGMLVIGVADGSEAADRRVEVGDVVVRVQDTPVTSLASFRGAFEAARKAGKSNVLVLTSTSDIGLRWVPFQLK